jgi:peptide deformylase
MAVKEILLLGNPALYKSSTEIEHSELPEIKRVTEDLRDTLIAFRKKNGFGRAIAAPQIGVLKRLIFMQIEIPVAILNPVLEIAEQTMITLWDDCMSFPQLLVKVNRFKHIRMRYKDLNWEDHLIDATDDLSELLQHEYDHLNGMLAVQRAINAHSFAMADQRRFLKV